MLSEISFPDRRTIGRQDPRKETLGDTLIDRLGMETSYLDINTNTITKETIRANVNIDTNAIQQEEKLNMHIYCRKCEWFRSSTRLTDTVLNVRKRVHLPTCSTYTNILATTFIL